MVLIDIRFTQEYIAFIRILEIFNFDLPIPNLVKLYVLDTTSIVDKTYADTFLRLDYESSVFILLYSSQIVIWAALIAAFPFIWLIGKVTKLDFFVNWYKSYKYNLVYRIFIEMYLDMSIACFINVFNL